VLAVEHRPFTLAVEQDGVCITAEVPATLSRVALAGVAFPDDLVDEVADAEQFIKQDS